MARLQLQWKVQMQRAFEETQFTVCEEAYNGLSDFLDEEGNFNVEGYINFCNSEADKTQNTEG